MSEFFILGVDILPEWFMEHELVRIGILRSPNAEIAACYIFYGFSGSDVRIIKNGEKFYKDYLLNCVNIPRAKWAIKEEDFNASA